MNAIVFGATGMVGQGALRECFLDRHVERVTAIGRTATDLDDPKLRQIVIPNLWDYSAIEGQLKDFDACFFALGASSAGMREPEYEHLTYDLTLAAAETLCRLNPGMTFVYVSGAGADSSESGKSMWARVRGKTENALLRLPFAGVYILRPGIIQPVHGARSKTAAYRIFYSAVRPVLPLMRALFPNHVLTTEELGRAMLSLAAQGYSKRVLESKDIRSVLRRDAQIRSGNPGGAVSG